ncbi:class I SAM-dependent methyltransferase [Paenibacillus sp. FSL K6-0108]|uniref:class I SAM-dependent methyltransferase n=1 Tax=Paenibacillus sp. FSL K6-0108 TaxID=2921417 RepID=UPI003252AB30
MEWLAFLKQYIQGPRWIGAIASSSKYLAAKMVEDIEFDRASCIVEYGPGTGVFTEMLLANIQQGTILILIENNARFCHLLRKKYGHLPNVHIIHDSAVHVDQYLRQYGVNKADYIVSGLPFASLPTDVSLDILGKSRQYLKQDGRFITFQYTLIKRGLLKQFFGNVSITRVYLNLPPAYVFSCSR